MGSGSGVPTGWKRGRPELQTGTTIWNSGTCPSCGEPLTSDGEKEWCTECDIQREVA